MFEYDKYYRECQQLNKPFIKARINPAHGSYYVQIDLMTCNYELSNQEQEEIKKLVQNEIEFVKLNSKHDFKTSVLIKNLHGLMVYRLNMWIIFVKVSMILHRNIIMLESDQVF